MPVLRAASKEPERFDDPTSVHTAAAQWMRYTNQVELVADGKIVQRYALVLLAMTLRSGSPFVVDPATDECTWPGVTCNSNATAQLYSPVESLAWPHQGLTGQIPQDIALLANLKLLDLAENKLTGRIPAGLYGLWELQYLYLQNNQFSGTLATRIGNLQKLTKAFLGDNLLTGTLPTEIGSHATGTSASLRTFFIKRPLGRRGTMMMSEQKVQLTLSLIAFNRMA